MANKPKRVIAFNGNSVTVYRSVLDASIGESVSRQTILNRIEDGNRLRNGSVIDFAIDYISYKGEAL